MDLVQVDRLYLQSTQTLLALLAYRCCFQAFDDLPVFIPTAFAFGEHVGFGSRVLLERLGDDSFGVAKSVHSGRIDPVDSSLQSCVDRADALGIILFAPRERPAIATDGPSPDSYGGNHEIRVTQLSLVHFLFNLFFINLSQANRSRTNLSWCREGFEGPDSSFSKHICSDVVLGTASIPGRNMRKSARGLFCLPVDF